MNQSLIEFDKMVLNREATWWEMTLPSGDVTFGSAKVEMLGFKEQDFKVYQDFTSLLPSEDYKKAMKAMRDHLSGRKEVYETVYRIKTKSGDYIKFYDCGKIVKKEGGDITLMGLVFKISDQKQVKELKKMIFEGEESLLDLVGRAAK